MRDQYRALYDNFRWHVPREFNIAEVCCRRWSQETTRIALHYEDETGATCIVHLRSAASRCEPLVECVAGAWSQARRARGDRIAAAPGNRDRHIAVYQMGAVAMPLSLLFGPDALEYRLQDSEAVVAIVDAAALASIEEVQARCPDLRHLIVVGDSGATNAVWHAWSALLARHSDDSYCRRPRWRMTRRY